MTVGAPHLLPCPAGKTHLADDATVAADGKRCPVPRKKRRKVEGEGREVVVEAV